MESKSHYVLNPESGSKGISGRMSKMRFYPKDSEKSMEATTNAGTVS